MCGDYNIDPLKIQTNGEFSLFDENIIATGFAPKITLPTRFRDTKSTLIDIVYSNVIDKSHTSGILIRPISNHQMYICIMDDNYVNAKAAQKYNFKWETTLVTHTSYNNVKESFINCEREILKQIQVAKHDYFNRIFTAYKTDMKKT